MKAKIEQVHWENAWKYFYPEGCGKAKKGYILHHKDDSLRNNDPIRYAEWRIEDLEIITRKEHTSRHFKGENGINFGTHLKEETKQKLHNRFVGISLSEEHKRKIGIGALGNKASTGFHWWNDGKRNVYSKESPDIGWVRGRL